MARQTRGRQRIPMRLIESQDDLYASFSKRRLGLFKKASELCTLCGADIGIIVFSPTDNPFSFFSPNMESVVDRYVSPDQPPKHAARAVDAHARFRIKKLNRQLDQLREQKIELKTTDEGLADIQKGWWEETPVETLNKEQVEDWIVWFNNFRDRVETQIQQLQINGSSSAAGLLDLGGGGGGGGGDEQCYYPSAEMDMYGGGESSSHYVFSPQHHRSPAADAGETGHYGFLSPTMNAPHHHVYSGGQDLCNVGQNNEDDAGTSNQRGD